MSLSLYLFGLVSYFSVLLYLETILFTIPEANGRKFVMLGDSDYFYNWFAFLLLFKK